MIEEEIIIRGRKFTEYDINIIKEILQQNPTATRRYKSKLICERLGWRQANGILKDRACLDVLLRLHNKELINCPPIRLSRRRKNQGGARKDKVNFCEPFEHIVGKVGDYKEFRFEMIRGTDKECLWDYLINTYHYLGYQVIVGHYLKYLIYLDNHMIGCIEFSDAVLHLSLRDRWIGWDADVRKKNLHLIINNNRYLILPWVKVKNASSKILGRIAKVVQVDWEIFYGYKPVLIETFVDRERFAAISYRAANWIYLGSTKGKGRRGMNYFYHGHPKDLYVYVLSKNYRKELTA